MGVIGWIVVGFVAGALIPAPMATRLIASVGVLRPCGILGLVSLVVTVAAGSVMRNPPEGWQPEGWVPRPALQSTSLHRLG